MKGGAAYDEFSCSLDNLCASLLESTYLIRVCVFDFKIAGAQPAIFVLGGVLLIFSA